MDIYIYIHTYRDEFKLHQVQLHKSYIFFKLLISNRSNGKKNIVHSLTSTSPNLIYNILFFSLSFIAFFSLFPFLPHSSLSHIIYGLQYKQRKTYMSKKTEQSQDSSLFIYFELGDKGKKKRKRSNIIHNTIRCQINKNDLVDITDHLCDCKHRTFKRDRFLAFYGY